MRNRGPIFKPITCGKHGEHLRWTANGMRCPQCPLPNFTYDRGRTTGREQFLGRRSEERRY